MSARPVFAQIAADLRSLEYDFTKAIKKTLLMVDWIAEVRTQDLESRYQAWAGAVRRIGEEYGWLVDALAGVARASGWPDTRSRALDVLADRLAYGVNPDALPVARLRARGVGRALVRRLIDAGFADREALRSGGRDALAGVLKNKTATAALWTAVEGAAARPQLKVPATGGADRAADAESPQQQPAPVLLVDLRSRSVTYRGHAIPTKPPNNLRRQSVLALAVLASRAGEIITMPDLVAGMRRLGHANRRVVTPEPREIRYQVIRPFRRALAGIVADEEVDSLVENIPGVGLRLTATGGAQVITTAPRRRSRAAGGVQTPQPRRALRR